MTASHHKHREINQCFVKVFWERIELSTNDAGVFGVIWRKGKLISVLGTVNYYFIDAQTLLDIMRVFLNYTD